VFQYNKFINKFKLKFINQNHTRNSLRFSVHLAEHCNLNCAGCEHFSPLAEAKLKNIDIIKNDFSRLSKITDGIIEELNLHGGEPLLNQQINDFLLISRKYFPESRINIMTNGILLDKQTDIFWQICYESNINIIITCYPIQINSNLIMEKAERFKVKIIYLGDPANKKPEWRKLKIDLNGKQNPILSNNLCYASNFCFQLVDGKLYKCWRIAYIKYFNNAFKKDLKVIKNDGYIDIYKARNAIEILNKLKKPAIFCRYCNIKESEYNLKWQYSKKEISEWT